MTVTLYGIPNCDSVKTARTWLDKRGVAYRFHDFRKDGLEGAMVGSWLNKVGLDTLLNRRGTTWRQLDETLKQQLDARNAVDLLLTYPTLIKRPVLVAGTRVVVGVDEAAWQSLL